MTQEDKELLFNDLCARLPYGVKCAIWNDYREEFNWARQPVEIEFYNNDSMVFVFENPYEKHGITNIKPYLRPISSMGPEERREWVRLRTELDKYTIGPEELVDFYNYHHFDYRRLIDEGLALEASEGMYKF